jgi:enterochelin esterase-like enzyme
MHNSVTGTLMPCWFSADCGLFLVLLVALSGVFQPAAAQPVDPDAAYQLGADSQRHDDVPRGRVSHFEWVSQIFPGTKREYSLYIPSQYDGTQPACLMVFQDGHAYGSEDGQMRVPVVFDNLIHQGRMPVTIGLFINPGHDGEAIPENRFRASNRSFEYDTLSDQYSRFVMQELLPHVISQQKLNISSDPADHAICGMSSGGICAFTAAWEHPEWFGKVLSHIGSFTNIRGAAILPESLDWLWRDHVVGKPPADVSNQPTVDAGSAYVEKSIRFSGGEYEDEEFRYRLMSPSVVEKDQKYPLVIFLHGAGERGSDNALQLLYLPTQLAQPQYRSRFPCYVLAPQCRTDRKWVDVDWAAKNDPVMPETPSEQLQCVMKMIELTLQQEQIDPDRVYLTGLSMGGFAVYDLAMRHPDRFAALGAICGAADITKVSLIRDVPTWIEHGADDTVVAVERSRNIANALRKAGGKPIFVELPGIGHNSWTPAYQNNDGLLPWMFRQKRHAKPSESSP